MREALDATIESLGMLRESVAVRPQLDGGIEGLVLSAELGKIEALLKEVMVNAFQQVKTEYYYFAQWEALWNVHPEKQFRYEDRITDDLTTGPHQVLDRWILRQLKPSTRHLASTFRRRDDCIDWCGIMIDLKNADLYARMVVRWELLDKGIFVVAGDNYAYESMKDRAEGQLQLAAQLREAQEAVKNEEDNDAPLSDDYFP